MLAPKADAEDKLLDQMKLFHTKKVAEIQGIKEPLKPVKPPHLIKKGAKKGIKKVRKSRSLLNLKPSPSFRAISRGTYYKVNTVRDPPPPCGYYNVNYELVDPNKAIKTMSHKKSKSLKKFDSTEPPFRNLKFPKKGDGFIDFNKQSPRQHFEKLQLKNDPHEKRFETLNLFPSIYSKTGKLSNQNFDNTSPRKDQFKTNMTLSVYNPNHEVSSKSICHKTVIFLHANSDQSYYINIVSIQI